MGRCITGSSNIYFRDIVVSGIQPLRGVFRVENQEKLKKATDFFPLLVWKKSILQMKDVKQLTNYFIYLIFLEATNWNVASATLDAYVKII